MAFIKWFEEIGHEIDADENERSRNNIYHINLVKIQKNGGFQHSLSPITRNLLNTWTNVLKSNKNLILNFPDNKIMTMPLLAYISSKITSKSTIIFTSNKSKNNLSKYYNQHYQLMRFAGSEYLYEDIPIGFLYDTYLKYVPHLIHAHKNIKYNKKEIIRENLISSVKPKILINSENNFTKIYNLINNVVIGDETTETTFNLDIGTIIFENADRFISSKSMLKNFSEWLNKVVDDNFTLLFHFSKPQPAFLREFKQLTNSLVLDFSNPILMNNTILKRYSLDYHNNLNLTQRNILKNYNLDSKSLFMEKNIKIIDPLLEKGNIDLYLYYAQQSLNNTNKNLLKNKIFFNYAINLLYSIPNLAIDPLRFKINFNIDGVWRYITIPHFLTLFKKKLNKEKDINQLPLNNLIANLSNIYHELSRCKHYFEDNGYHRVAKSYKIIDIAINKSDYFDDDRKLLIGTFQKTEDSYLNKLLADVDDVASFHLNKLFLNFNDFSEYNLLLPGVIYNTKNVPILESNFNQILILAYDGYNNNLIQKQVDMILNPPLTTEKVSMDYYDELYKFIKISTKNDFFKDYNQRKMFFDAQESQNYLNNNENNDSFDLLDNYDSYIKGKVKSNAEIDNMLVNMYSSSNNYPIETIDVSLSNVSDGKIYNKKLVKNRKYLRFKSYDKLENSLEVRPDLFKKNDYVIVLENNKSFLEIYMDIFGEGNEINKNFIEYWRDLLHDYIHNNNLNVKEVYEEYSDFLKNESNLDLVTYNTFRLWANGFAISPSNKEYLKSLGEFFHDEYLLEYYEEMDVEANRLRTINRNMGRRLSKLIKNVIFNTGFLDYNMLSFEERNIYNLIKNSIYQVI